MKLLILILSLTFSSIALAKLPKQLRVCDDGEEWPPYTYFDRVKGKKSKQIVGFSVDYLKKVLERENITFTIELIPWGQCLEGVRSGKFDMLLNSAFNSEREKWFLVSKSYYALTPVYFYDVSAKAPVVEKIEDLKKYKVCGVKNYNYRAGFELSPEMMDVSSLGIFEAFTKLKEKKCDLVPERLEVVLGYKTIEKFDYSKIGIGYLMIPYAQIIPFYMMISPKTSYAQELLLFLNKRIEQINDSDFNFELGKKYFPLEFFKR